MGPAVIGAILFVVLLLVIGGLAVIPIFLEAAPFGFECPKHGYFEGKLTQCPRCDAGDRYFHVNFTRG